ncbi:hypothetical protein C9374_006317 [Naegleria lovaniensis]|uniref:Uncharacterized protein n=1 Tax=Naegleria lovaniensis TaxID=51637 RepID=A0AA88GNL2_NAELO|nr:uncharacterized protein C9374_006317 [Naegleria lovaniensis]KAG2381328.1 hypothetical protein C9374_006317 [Naegleria lovaniensis]
MSRQLITDNTSPTESERLTTNFRFTNEQQENATPSVITIDDKRMIIGDDDHYSAKHSQNNIDLEAQQEREINKLKNGSSFYPTNVDWSVIGNFSGIESNVQKLLRGVYMLLAASVLCATFGCAVSIYYNLQPSILYNLVSFGLVIYVTLTSSMPGLLALGLSFGFQFGPLIRLIITEIDPYIPLYALVGTTLILSCFSVAAHFSKRRSMLFIGATLSSFLSLKDVMLVMKILFEWRFSSLWISSLFS